MATATARLAKACAVEQQPRHHPAQQNPMTLVTGRAVLTQEAGQLSMQLGTGCHRVLVWSDSPTLLWLPAHPII